MANQAQFDLAEFSSVKLSMDAALAEVSARLEQYLAEPALNGQALDAARGELHRLTGVLKMLRLDGLVAFCTELETVLSELAANSALVSVLHRDVLRRALLGLIHYLDALSQGADNAALRLFPQYQEMQQLRGHEMAFELDLFFPNIAIHLPESVLGIAQQSDALTRIKTARSHYQQGLMHYLRQDGVPAALQAMQQAINTVLACLSPDDGRAFWWAASGLLDCVKLDGLPPELTARKLFGRIDYQMRAIIENNTGDVLPDLNEILLLIASSHSVSDQVEQIKLHYALDVYLPELVEVTHGEATRLLGGMQELIGAAEESWALCLQGDAAASKKFGEIIGQLAQQSEKLDRNTLQPLTKQMQSLSVHLGDTEQAKLLGIDMAMALLLLESGIEHYTHLDGSFQEQVRILSERIQATLAQQPEDTRRLSELIGLHLRMGQNKAKALLANEMRVNLQYVEQSLSAFFSDVSNRAELSGLQRLLEQIRGGLSILSLERAAQLLFAIQDSVRSFEQSGAAPRLAESQALAGAVGALDNLMQHLAFGHKQEAGEALQAALDELSKLRQTAEPGAVLVGVPQVLSSQPGEDQELLDVFLEEAQEVLGIMRDNIEIYLLHPGSQEPIVTIRRGFHTLKGSGRMVGLTDLGEVAWEIEQALNKWLQENKPATPGLLQFIIQAEQAFSGWISSLLSKGSVSVEAADLVAMAQQIVQGIDPGEAKPKQAAADVPQQATTPASSSDSDQVVIGDVTVSPALFKIASDEAKLNALALQKQFELLCETVPPQVQYDFMRAAHTLAGVNRAMGFTAVTELAYALEGWLQARIDKPFVLHEAQLLLLEQAVEELNVMAQGICDKQMPRQRGDLSRQLLEDKENLSGESIPHQGADAAPAQPAAPREVSKTDEQAKTKKSHIHDDVDEELLPVFLEEADDLIAKIGAGLRACRKQPDDAVQIRLLNRLLHTIKGSARMAGAMRIGEVVHEMEDRVQSVKQDGDQAGYWDGLDNDFDRINGMLDELRGGKTGAEGNEAAEVADPVKKAERRTLDVGAERALISMLRIRSDVLDRLVNDASEIRVARSRMETELRAFKDGLLELNQTVARMRSQLQEVEIQAESQLQTRFAPDGDNSQQFDPLEFDRYTRLHELTCFMAESVHDVQTVQQLLLKNVDETTAAMSVQARINREMQQGLMNVRMVPFSSISERLYRIVRQTAKELNKPTNLELVGTSVEMDRSVLEKMTAPFEHLLRNAIAHGLEAPAQRERLGKPASGEIHLSLRQESNEVVFELRDDGSGLDMARLQQKALEYGVLHEGEEISEEQAIQMIFKPGLSTAQEVTEISGRGVGLDVVRSEVNALGGRLDVVSTAGKGLSFSIHLPLTLAVTRTLMVRAGTDTYAIPATMIVQAQQLKPQAFEEIYRARKIEWQGKTYPLCYLTRLLGDEGIEPVVHQYNALLLLHSGENRIALHVDEMIGNQEVVVKNIGPQLARMPGIGGATVTGSGAVVLILNPIALAQQISVSQKNTKVAAAVAPARRVPLVMVVDDSLTVRKSASRMLMRAGYQVATAKDGVDALEQLANISPSLMLLDVEMPRMDGFELAKRLRQDRQTQDLPIIMITSRTADKHRNYALEIGVNEYMGKPFQEEVLLEYVARFVPLS